MRGNGVRQRHLWCAYYRHLCSVWHTRPWPPWASHWALALSPEGGRGQSISAAWEEHTQTCCRSWFWQEKAGHAVRPICHISRTPLHSTPCTSSLCADVKITPYFHSLIKLSYMECLLCFYLLHSYCIPGPVLSALQIQLLNFIFEETDKG